MKLIRFTNGNSTDSNSEVYYPYDIRFLIQTFQTVLNLQHLAHASRHCEVLFICLSWTYKFHRF